MSRQTNRFFRVESLENRNLLSATTLESEPNDRQSSADVADFSSGQAILEGVSDSDKDKDFFAVIVPSTGQINVQVSSANGEFAQVEVEDATGRQRFETDPNDGVNSGGFTATAGEQLYVRLRAKDDAPAHYSVNLVATNGGTDAPATPTDPIAPGSDDGTPDQGSGDAPGTTGADDNPTPGSDDGTPDQGSGDVPGTTGADDNPTPGSDDGTPDQGSGDVPGTAGADDNPTPGSDDGTPDQGSGDAPGTKGADDSVTNPPVTADAGSVVSESESNDRQSQANAFSLDASGNATLFGVSESDDDKDYFVFTAPADGILHVNVNSSNGNFAQAQIENTAGIELFDTEPNDGINSGSVAVTSGQNVFVRMRSKTDGIAEYAVDLVFAERQSPVTADADGDGSVGFSDFLRLSRFFGQSDRDAVHGDFDGDGLVSFSDFLILSKLFG